MSEADKLLSFWCKEKPPIASSQQGIFIYQDSLVGVISEDGGYYSVTLESGDWSYERNNIGSKEQAQAHAQQVWRALAAKEMT